MSWTLSLTTASVACPAKRGESRATIALAGPIACLVERHVEKIGDIGGLIARPADREGDACLRPLQTRRGDIEPIRAPVHGRGDARRRIGREVDRPVRDPAGGFHGLETPAALLVEPLVAALDLVEAPDHPRLRQTRAVRGGENHVEGGGRPLGEVVPKILANTEHRPLRKDRQRDAALDRASARLADPQDDPRLRRPGGRKLGDRHLQGDAALRVGRAALLDLGGRGFDLLVRKPDGEAVQAFDPRRLRRLDHDLAGDLEIRARGAVEIAGCDIDLRRLAGAQGGRLRGQADLEPFGDVILDQEARLADRRALRVDIGRDAPRSAHGARKERQREGAPADALVLDQGAPVFDAVRPPRHEREGKANDGGALGVAQERRDEYRLARAIHTALGEQVSIGAARCRAPFHAAVGEVEGGLAEIEKAVVAVRARDHETRSLAPLPARETRIEGHVPTGIGRAGSKNLVVAGDQSDVDAGQRRGVREGAHEDVHAVRAFEGGQAEVRDDEPLRCARAVIFLVEGAVLRPRRHDVDARLELAHGLQDGESGDDVFVQLGFRLERALPDARAFLALDAFGGVAPQLAQELVGAERRQKVAVADAADLDLDLTGVDRHHRDALLPGARQNVIAAGEPHLRRAIANVDLVIGRLEQGFADGGRQPLPQHHGVALAMLQSVDAELRLVRRHRRIGHARDGHEGREIDPPLREGIGELETGTRRGGIGIHLVFDDAKAVLGAEVLIGAANVRLVADLQARPVGVERRPPGGLRRVCLAEEGQGLRFVGPRRGPLIGRIGGRDGPLLQPVALAVIARLNRDRSLGEAEPVACLPGLCRDSGREQRKRTPGIAARRRRLPFRAELRARPPRGRGPGLSLELLLEPDRVAGEVVAHEALLGRSGGRETDSSGEHGHLEEAPNHRKSPREDAPHPLVSTVVRAMR